MSLTIDIVRRNSPAQKISAIANRHRRMKPTKFPSNDPILQHCKASLNHSPLGSLPAGIKRAANSFIRIRKLKPPATA